ncbi:hypothetical protein LPJ74_004300 [Coemansia sp. RSA 1843]|nr:hypothetical protein LPJ74_004300 [Coemansia sp. RSA 1843]
MHTHRQQRPQGSNAWNQHPAAAADYDDDEDDHVPLSMMAGAGQQNSGVPPSSYGHFEQQMYQPQQLLYQQQQQQQQQALLHHQQYAANDSINNNANAPPMINYASPGVPQTMPPLDYQQQLEMELEHQQRQFQQQFLEQYRQMQMQPQDPSMQEWVDDGFTDQAAIPASYHMAGFQDTPYNPNLPHPHAELPPQLASATAFESPYCYQQPQQQQHFQSWAESSASKRRTKDRPWVNASSGTNNNSKMPAKATTHSSTNKNVATSSFSESGDSDESSETSSSDESAYNIDSDEERSKTSVPTASPSRAVSTKKSHRSSKHSSPTPQSASVQKTVSKPSGERGRATGRKNAVNDDDDDLPLSVISRSSTHKDTPQATVRRTKSAMPASSPSPRSRYFGTITKKLSAMSHRGSLKQTKSPRPKVRHDTGESDTNANAGSKTPRRSAESPDTDDEDQPLDQIKSDLEAGAKHVSVRGSNESESAHSSLTSSSGQAESSSSENEHGPNQVDNLDGDDDASKKKRSLSERQLRLLQTLKSSMAKANHKAEVDKHQQDSSSSEGPELSNASASESRCASSPGSSLRSRTPSRLSGKSESLQSRLSSNEESVHGSAHKPEDRDSDAASHRSQHSRQSSASRYTASPHHTKSVVSRPRKENSYLPTGIGLPRLPVRPRTAKTRAAVQYIALADIAENTERAQRKGDAEYDSAEESSSDRDIDGADKEKRLRRKMSRKGGDGAPSQEDGLYDTQSLASRNTASSSGGTLMELLRTGPVELLTASTDNSGSKAAIEMLSPEDYGDIDQLLSDLDGIMNGSLAARRRFSLAVMRRSIAVGNGLVEPADYGESEHDERAANTANVRESFIEFKPLEIAEFDTGAGSLLSEGLGMDNMLLPSEANERDDSTSNAIDSSNRAGHHGYEDDDTQPLSELAQKPSLLGELETQVAALDVSHDMLGSIAAAAQLQPDAMSQHVEQSHPRELTRAEKVNKALEKLEVLNVRKISIRIYIQDAQRYYTFSLTKYTTCEMLIGDMKKSRIIDPDKETWALFELVVHFGIERPLNHFENLMGIVESWEPRSNNYLILKGFSQQSLLSLGGGIQLGDHAIQGMLYYRIKKNKWQKGVFRLQDHSVILAKDGRGKTKKEAHYLTLTNNDVYTPFKPLRGAPTRFVFGLKSEMPMQMFEKPDEDYVKWFAVHTLDGLREWLKVLRLSKNQIKFCQVLERRVIDTYSVKDSENKGPSTKPLVDLSQDRHEDAEGAARRNTGDVCVEMVSMLNKVATSTKYDPATLIKAVEQKGMDISDLRVLSFGANGQQDASNDDIQAPEAMFLPGSLLSKPKKSAIEAEADKQQDAELFVKGSLLSQPRESKALEASRAMQNVMAHNGNVFTQGSLLQITQQTKPRPPHVGGAANVMRSQFPLMQLDEPDIGAPGHLIRQAGNSLHPTAAAAAAATHASPYMQHGDAVPDDHHVFGGLLAATTNVQKQTGEPVLQPSNMYNTNTQTLHYR